MTSQDQELLEKKGISEKQIEEQLACFEKGFPYLRLAAAASVDNGILVPTSDEQKTYLEIAEKTGASTATISRVNRSLNYGNDGYDMVFERIDAPQEEA